MVPLFLRFLLHTDILRMGDAMGPGIMEKYLRMSKHIIFTVLIAILVFASCKSIKPERAPAPTLPEPPVASSSINFPIEIPLSQIEQRLNALPTSRLFQDQGLPLGSGLTADVDVNRNGPLKLHAGEGNHLRLKLPMRVRGNLKFEKKVFGQVLSTNIPFDEAVAPLFDFEPSIGSDWQIRIQDLKIEDWGRSLRYNLLGFEIDLEPLIDRQVQRVLDNQVLASNLGLLDFKKIAQATWDQFVGSYALEIEGLPAYIVSRPESLHFNQEIGTDQVLRLYIGIEGKIDAGLGSAPKVGKEPLPALSANGRTDNALDLQVPLVIPFSELDAYLNRQFSGQILRIDSNTTLAPSNFQTSQYGDKTLLSMDFMAVRKDRKEIQGKMYFAGKAAYDRQAKTLQLTKPQFDVKSDDFFSNLAMRLKKGKIQRQMRKVANFPIGSMLADAPGSLERILRLDLDFGTIVVDESTLDVAGIYQTDKDIRVYLIGKGKVKVEIKP
jgi:hypothetical protein